MAYKGRLLFATIAQEVERNIGNVEVTGSTPVSSFLCFLEGCYEKNADCSGYAK